MNFTERVTYVTNATNLQDSTVRDLMFMGWVYYEDGDVLGKITGTWKYEPGAQNTQSTCAPDIRNLVRPTNPKDDHYNITVFSPDGDIVGSRKFRICGTCWAMVHEQSMNRHIDWHIKVEKPNG